MKRVLLLPGYSPHNKQIQDKLADFLQEKGFVVEKIEWEHWKEGKSFSYPRERKKIKEAIERLGKGYSVVAKSIGTRVVADMIVKGELEPQKVVFLGVPSLAREFREAFERRDIPLIIIQNSHDPLLKAKTVKEFFSEFLDSFEFIEKPAKDHNYPYFEDILRFLV